MINLKLKSQIDNIYNYDIYKDNVHIGIIYIIKHEDRIFIQQIHIFKEYARKGYATQVMNKLYNENKKIRLCISTISQSAKPFWINYFKNKDVIKLKSELYEITNPILD